MLLTRHGGDGARRVIGGDVHRLAAVQQGVPRVTPRQAHDQEASRAPPEELHGGRLARAASRGLLRGGGGRGGRGGGLGQPLSLEREHSSTFRYITIQLDAFRYMHARRRM